MYQIENLKEQLDLVFLDVTDAPDWPFSLQLSLRGNLRPPVNEGVFIFTLALKRSELRNPEIYQLCRRSLGLLLMGESNHEEVRANLQRCRLYLLQEQSDYLNAQGR